MKLTELEPRWIAEGLFIFRCPHCIELRRAGLTNPLWWLTARSVPMNNKEQRELYERVLGDHWNMELVPSNPEARWTISGTDFATLSVHPSIDASAAGHWHGFITNGEAR